MRDDGLEKLQVYSLTVIACALLGALIGLGGALVKNSETPRRERPPIIVTLPAPIATTVAPGQEPYDRLLKAIEAPRPPEKKPAPVPPPPPEVASIAVIEGRPVSCVIAGLEREQVQLRPGDQVGDSVLERIELEKDGAKVVFRGPKGEWSLRFSQGGE
jgi:hypothetical protein